MENSQLTIADLAALYGMIETACNRGAFKAGEMSQVGQIYDKLGTFLKIIQERAKAEAEQAQAQPAGEQNA